MLGAGLDLAGEEFDFLRQAARYLLALREEIPVRIILQHRELFLGRLDTAFDQLDDRVQHLEAIFACELQFFLGAEGHQQDLVLVVLHLFQTGFLGSLFRGNTLRFGFGGEFLARLGGFARVDDHAAGVQLLMLAAGLRGG